MVSLTVLPLLFITPKRIFGTHCPLQRCVKSQVQFFFYVYIFIVVWKWHYGVELPPYIHRLINFHVKNICASCLFQSLLEGSGSRVVIHLTFSICISDSNFSIVFCPSKEPITYVRFHPRQCPHPFPCEYMTLFCEIHCLKCHLFRPAQKLI